MEVCADVYGLLILEPARPRLVPPRGALSTGWELCRGGSGAEPGSAVPVHSDKGNCNGPGCACAPRPQPGGADAALQSRQRRGNFWPAVPSMGRSGGSVRGFIPRGSAGTEMKVPGEEEQLPPGSSSGGAGGCSPAPRESSSSMAGP